MLSRAGSNRCLVERAWADVESIGPGRFRVEQARDEVKPSGLRPLSIRSCPGRCRVVRALISSRPDWYIVVLDQADVELSGPMQCRAERGRDEVEPFGPRLVWSRAGLGRGQAERAQAVV